MVVVSRVFFSFRTLGRILIINRNSNKSKINMMETKEEERKE